jgi:hypothetical protein
MEGKKECRSPKKAEKQRSQKMHSKEKAQRSRKEAQ